MEITNRGKVYYKTGGCCAYCGEHLNPFEPWTVDHIIPVSRGGKDEFLNLFPACKICNSRKGTRLISEWRERLIDAIPEEMKKGYPEGKPIITFYFEKRKNQWTKTAKLVRELVGSGMS